jgi:Tol biopolymer transport system component
VKRIIGVALLALMLGTTGPSAALATFPGGDGRIAFYSFNTDPNRIGTIEPDGSDRLWLTGTAGRDSYTPAWSADGSMVAFATNARGGGRVLIMNADGTGRSVVFESRRRLFSPSEPAWSPDGERIAFAVLPRRGPTHIAVINVDGTGLVVIDSRSNSVAPDWSPDGARIVFQQFGRTDAIKTMDPDGNDRETVIEGGAVPSWSPDGSQIVFTKGGRHDRNVFIVGADGSDPTRLTDTPNRYEYTPAFSPQGDRIAYCRVIGNDPFSPCDIWIMNADGTEPTRITETSRIDEFDLSWQPV